MREPCPSCGYCPHCRRGGHDNRPFPLSPSIWMGDTTTSTTDAGDTDWIASGNIEINDIRQADD